MAIKTFPHLQGQPDNSSDWQTSVERRLSSYRGIPIDLVRSSISFFERAFQNTHYPQRAWFGVPPTSVSLVLGGIYLAAIVRPGKDRGIWLLVDQAPPPIDGVEYRPVLSTQNSTFPLVWAHSPFTLPTIQNLIANDDIWESFAAASEKITFAKRIAADRDEQQVSWGKRRLSEFWPASPKHLFPDELDEGTVFYEGAKRQVTVNAYERDSRVRHYCIQHYGTRCFICNFSFEEIYGKTAKGFIHVHHLRPLSEIRGQYEVDPIKDLRPVCPNCHAVLHLRKPAFSIEEVIEMIRNPGESN